jgi:hypothetical protein
LMKRRAASAIVVTSTSVWCELYAAKLPIRSGQNCPASNTRGEPDTRYHLDHPVGGA